MAEFREEFLTNATVVLASEAYERYRTLAEAKKPANVLGCGISFVAQDLERAFVCCAIQTLQSKGYEVGTIIHDGFLVWSLLVKDQDLRDAEEAVRRTHGYEVRFVKKRLGDFDEAPSGIAPTRTKETRTPQATRIWRGRSWVARGPRAPPRPRRQEDILVRPGARRVPREREASSGEEVHEPRAQLCPRRTEERRGSSRSSSVQIEGLLEDDRLPRPDHRHDSGRYPSATACTAARPEARGLRRGHVFSGEGLGGVRSPERGAEGRGVPAGVPGRLRHGGDRSLRA